MSKSFKAIFPLVFLAFVGYAISVALFAYHTQTAMASFTPTQGRVPQDLSGSYKGTVYLRDRTNTQCLMVGLAKLEIQESRFTLSNNEGKQFKGEIKALILQERDNLGVGELKLENEDPIEIRWYRNEGRKKFKIIPAKGAKREFRFCSSKLTQDECFGTVES